MVKRFIKEPIKVRDVMSVLRSGVCNKILHLLEEEGAMTVGDVVSRIGDTTKYALSYHLKRLREVGLVVTKRDSTRIYCSVDPDRKEEITDWLNKFPETDAMRLKRVAKLFGRRYAPDAKEISWCVQHEKLTDFEVMHTETVRSSEDFRMMAIKNMQWLHDHYMQKIHQLEEALEEAIKTEEL